MNVKSAVRVIEVLEFFDSVKRDASLSEVAGALGYPLSSTSMLLQSLVESYGALLQDAVRRFCAPAANAAAVRAPRTARAGGAAA